MGLLDFLFGKKEKTKTLLLDKPKVIEHNRTSKIVEKPSSKIYETISIKYSEGSGKHTNTTMTLEPGGITFVKILGKETTEEFKKEEVLLEIQKATLPVFEATNKTSLDEAKKEAVNKLNQICSQNPGVHLYKIGREYIQNYETENIVNYEILEELPSVTDFTILPQEKREMIEKQLSFRLKILDSIKTPEDAYNDKENLIYFMQTQENLPISSIIDANIQSSEEGKQLDEATVKRIAKNMPKLSNEDGALYSVYLKIEEKRIWEKVKQTLEGYCGDNKDGNTAINQLIPAIFQRLETYELQQIEGEGGFSEDILKYIISVINGNGIDEYIDKVKELDSNLAMLVQKIDIPEKSQILQFIHARMQSFGQVSYRSRMYDKNHFRNYVANTNFKDEDNSNTKKFLLLVSKIEREYAQKQHKQVLESIPKKERQDNEFKEKLGIGYTPTATEKNVGTSIGLNRDSQIGGE